VRETSDSTRDGFPGGGPRVGAGAAAESQVAGRDPSQAEPALARVPHPPLRGAARRRTLPDLLSRCVQSYSTFSEYRYPVPCNVMDNLDYD